MYLFGAPKLAALRSPSLSLSVFLSLWPENMARDVNLGSAGRQKANLPVEYTDLRGRADFYDTCRLPVSRGVLFRGDDIRQLLGNGTLRDE